MNSIINSAIPDYTHESLVAHFLDQDYNGFAGTNCPRCKKTINLMVTVGEKGWLCPNCGEFTEVELERTARHAHPDMGPTNEQIDVAEAEALEAETRKDLLIPRHMKLVMFRDEIEELRDGESNVHVVPGVRLYALAPKTFPAECGLQIDKTGACCARTEIDGEIHRHRVLPARSPEVATIVFNRTPLRKAAQSPAVDALIQKASELIGADRARHATRLLSARPRDTSEKEENNGKDQLIFALTAAAELGLRVAILLPGSLSTALPLITTEVREISPDITIGGLTADDVCRAAPSSNQVTLVARGAFSKFMDHIQRVGGIPVPFDVIVASQWIWTTRDPMLFSHLSQALLFVVWLTAPPEEWNDMEKWRLGNRDPDSPEPGELRLSKNGEDIVAFDQA